jgi:hypothetical protein
MLRETKEGMVAMVSLVALDVLRCSGTAVLISLKDWSSSSASDVLRDVVELAEAASLDSALDVCNE